MKIFLCIVGIVISIVAFFVLFAVVLRFIGKQKLKRMQKRNFGSDIYSCVLGSIRPYSKDGSYIGPKTTVLSDMAFVAEKRMEDENTKKCDGCIFCRSLRSLDNGEFMYYYCGYENETVDFYSSPYPQCFSSYQAIYYRTTCSHKVTEDDVRKSLKNRGAESGKQDV